MTLPERIRMLDVTVAGQASGRLVHDSQHVFTYARDDAAQRPVGLLMPATRLEYRDTALFPVMDQNLPEGFLFQRLREAFPKQPLTPMHLLALIGNNGIGALGFALPGATPDRAPTTVSRKDLLEAASEEGLFEQLLQAYLSTGVGVSGLQPKILVPERATIPVPNLIVKAGSPAYPGLAANEFLCLRAAQLAGIVVPAFELSHNGQLLVIERFDLTQDGGRIGFEDIAALMGRQVRDVLADRKYHGSYEAVAELLKIIRLPAADLAEFFAQVALSVMVRNGDAHLKNFGVLYRSVADARLAPVFDVVTTAVYRYARYDGGPPMEDHTLALKLRRGRHATRTYPSTEELVAFGQTVCGVARPHRVIARIAQGMSEALAQARTDPRIPKPLLEEMQAMWERGLFHARQQQS